MINYNDTASRFSLPNSGRANSGVSNVKDSVMSVSVSSIFSFSPAQLELVTNIARAYGWTFEKSARVYVANLEAGNVSASSAEELVFVSGATLTISIGRNVPKSRVFHIPSMVLNDVERDTHELTDDAWLSFQCSIDEFRSAGIADTKALGNSKYLGENEETCVFQWFDAEPLTERERALLSSIREEYGQDAIAVSYSVPDFI